MLCEGIFLMGLFAYVAVLLLEAGEPRASIAGLVIASFAVGGIIYSISIGALLRLLGQKRVMIAGGLLMAFGIAALAFAPPWQVQCVVFAVMGLGFYMLHASIQVFVTELAPATRSSAIAFHTFSIFVGQSIGTVAFGYGLAYLGVAADARDLRDRHRADRDRLRATADAAEAGLMCADGDYTMAPITREGRCSVAMSSFCLAVRRWRGPSRHARNNRQNPAASSGFRRKRNPTRSWMVSVRGCASAATWKARTLCLNFAMRLAIPTHCARC